LIGQLSAIRVASRAVDSIRHPTLHRIDLK
jgi:hypothetical protein